MRVAILGAGPAGLYLAYLIKRRDRSAEVRVLEQNGTDATFGFGVVFSDRALEFLNEDDADTYAAILPHLESWTDITIVHRDDRVRIDGVGFAAIGRLKLLHLLQARARSVGVNSLVRRTHQTEFGAATTYLSNRFAWFGTRKPFETLTQTFQRSDLGD